MSLPVAILAGGLATRLRPITEKIPKSLVELAGEPFIVHQLRLLGQKGIDQVVLCLGYLGEMVEQLVGDGRQFGLKVQYSFDGPVLLGTAGALRRAQPLLGESFFVLYGDSYLDIDYLAVAQAFARSGKLGLMTVCLNRNQWDRSNILFRDGRIGRYNKRQPDAQMEHVDFGLGVLSRRALDEAPVEGPCDLAGLYQRLIELGQLAGYDVGKRFYEIGSFQGLQETEDYLLARRAGR